jgi:hypothetical protein
MYRQDASGIRLLVQAQNLEKGGCEAAAFRGVAKQISAGASTPDHQTPYPGEPTSHTTKCNI